MIPEHPPRPTLHVEVNEDGTVGGSHKALFDLVVRMDRSHFAPEVLFYQENAWSDRLRAEGIPVHEWDSVREEERARRIAGGVGKYLDFAGAIWRRRRLLKEQKIELVHLNNSPLMGSDDWLPAARLSGVPIVASYMSLASMDPSGLHRTLTRSYDHYLPVSDWMARRLGQMGVRSSRVTTVHHGLDLEELAQIAAAATGELRSEVRAEFEVGDDQVLVIMLANIRPWKGQLEVVRGAARLPPRLRDRLRLIMVGGAGVENETYLRQVEAAVMDEDLSNQVHLAGHRSDALKLLSVADLAVHASIEPEPGGIAVLEALALGCPVIAAEEGGHCEALGDGAGLVFDPLDEVALSEALEAVMTDPDSRRSMARAGRRNIQAFSIDSNVRGSEAVFHSLLGGSRASPADGQVADRDRPRLTAPGLGRPA